MYPWSVTQLLSRNFLVKTNTVRASTDARSARSTAQTDVSVSAACLLPLDHQSRRPHGSRRRSSAPSKGRTPLSQHVDRKSTIRSVIDSIFTSRSYFG
jgi:hypothetical protein